MLAHFGRTGLKFDGLFAVIINGFFAS